MPAVNDVGEPCAGEPHARFDGRELETEYTGPRPRQWDILTGNRRNSKAAGPTARMDHRASSRPYRKVALTERSGRRGPVRHAEPVALQRKDADSGI
jgi:hypothetical protein